MEQIFWIIGGIASLFLSFFIVRWFWGINKMLKNQKAIIEILIQIAKKQGVTDEEAKNIILRNY